jgi:hypothetical protein
MSATSTATVPSGQAMVNVFDGTRASYSDSKPLLITVTDGNHKVVSRDFHPTASTYFPGLPFFDNFGDDYSFIASADNYKDAGYFPVKINPKVLQSVDLMILPKSNTFNFSNATWDKLGSAKPKAKALFAKGAADDTAAAMRYSDLEETNDGEILACLLNITTAMDQIQLPQGTVLDYFKAVIWELQGPSSMARDRFYAWADPAIIPQLDLSKTQGEFADAPFGLHPGATRSYKQIEFGEANVQLTFHENDMLMIDGINCVKIEPDIDYFRDPGAHLLLEVAVNAFGSLSDPRTVYALRWIAGQRAGIPEFDPLYTIEKA